MFHVPRLHVASFLIVPVAGVVQGLDDQRISWIWKNELLQMLHPDGELPIPSVPDSHHAFPDGRKIPKVRSGFASHHNPDWSLAIITYWSLSLPFTLEALPKVCSCLPKQKDKKRIPYFRYFPSSIWRMGSKRWCWAGNVITDVRTSIGGKIFLEILPLTFICLCTKIRILLSFCNMVVASRNSNCELKPHCDEC